MCVCVHVCFLYTMAWDPFSVMFQVICAKYKGIDLLWNYTMSRKVFLLPGMIYALPSPNIADKNCISVDSMESY